MKQIGLDVIVVGTRRGVGTSYAVARAALDATEARRTPGVIAPAQTGTRDVVREACAFAPGAIGSTVYRYVPDFPPALAAQMERKQAPSVATIVEAIEELRATTDGVLVDGGAGLLWPYSDTESVADLAAAAVLPVVLVCQPTFDDVHVARLTANVARLRRVELGGIALNRVSESPGVEERNARAQLAEIAPIVAQHADELAPVAAG